MTDVYPDFEPDPIECWNCHGEGRVAGCMVDFCDCGGEDDPFECCAPSRCDVCGGRGHLRDKEPGEA